MKRVKPSTTKRIVDTTPTKARKLNADKIAKALGATRVPPEEVEAFKKRHGIR